MSRPPAGDVQEIFTALQGDGVQFMDGVMLMHTASFKSASATVRASARSASSPSFPSAPRVFPWQHPRHHSGGWGGLPGDLGWYLSVSPLTSRRQFAAAPAAGADGRAAAARPRPSSASLPGASAHRYLLLHTAAGHVGPTFGRSRGIHPRARFRLPITALRFASRSPTPSFT